MPGQPAWTLTEMLECNLPLCWAGGGDCNVGPAQCVGGPFIYLLCLSPLGLQEAVLIIKTCGVPAAFFLREQQPGFSFLEQPWVWFFWRRKNGGVL